jgi:excisionase family DNA binding protein
MLTAADVADMLACSTKTVYRLVDRGAIPRPVRLGGMLRWHRPRLEQWIADGCPSDPSSN